MMTTMSINNLFEKKKTIDVPSSPTTTMTAAAIYAQTWLLVM